MSIIYLLDTNTLSEPTGQARIHNLILVTRNVDDFSGFLDIQLDEKNKPEEDG